MRVLLDECLPERLDNVLPDDDVRTVPEAGWAGKNNGELLQLASADFDVFVTIDHNLQYQHKLKDAAIAVIVLESHTNRFEDLLPLVPRLIDVLRGEVSPRQVVRIAEWHAFQILRVGEQPLHRDPPQAAQSPRAARSRCMTNPAAPSV